jgi:Dioxygenase
MSRHDHGASLPHDLETLLHHARRRDILRPLGAARLFPSSAAAPAPRRWDRRAPTEGPPRPPAPTAGLRAEAAPAFPRRPPVPTPVMARTARTRSRSPASSGATSGRVSAGRARRRSGSRSPSPSPWWIPSRRAPVVGAAVYLWHCDAVGRYSLYSSGVTGESWLRGMQATDASGQVRFTTIFPGCYSGRWPHAHFEIYPSLAAATSSANKRATSQLAFLRAAAPRSTPRARTPGARRTSRG